MTVEKTLDERSRLFKSFVPRRWNDEKMTAYDLRCQDILQQENESYIQDLEAKVQSLKSISISMQNEVKYSNKLLTGIGNQFDHAKSALASTMKKMENLLASRSGYNIWYLMLFALLILFIMYILYYRKTP